MTASELIYLFIDGEADAAERTALLEQLPHNEALQQEFQDVLKMRTATTTVAQQTAPPAELTRGLFARAGIIAATLPGGVAGTATGTASIGIMKAVLIALAAAAAGSAITAMLFLGAPASPTGRVSSSTLEQRPPASHAQIGEASRSAAALPSRGHSVRTRSAPMVMEELGVRSGGSGRAGDVHADAMASRVIPPPITAAAVRYIPGIGSASESRSFEIPSVAPATVAHYPWTVAARGLQTLQLFPQRSTLGYAGGVVNNAAIDALYTFAGGDAIGVEFGVEDFPLYVQSASGSFDRRETVAWGGIAMRITPSWARLPGGFWGFSQEMLGVTTAGPLAKSIIGIGWRFDPRVTMSAGVEGTLLLHQLGARWSGLQKLGFTYGMALQF